jgi:hypothetical protein
VYCSFPPDAEGSITVVEVGPDGRIEVRPTLNELCQRVTAPRSAGRVKLEELIFVPDQKATIVVWVLLTDRPAAVDLKSALANQTATAEFRGPTVPRFILDATTQRGIRTLAVGRVELAPSP